MKSIIAVAALALATAASAQQPDFLATAAQGDMAEVQMGKLAQTQGKSSAVKSYGKMLATDHGAHAEKVAALAKTRHVTLPTTVSAAQKADYDHMASLRGADFDTAFKGHMIADHKKDIALYKTQTSANDAAVAALAKTTLPVLEKHLASAEKL
jgi:putative membrane protein